MTRTEKTCTRCGLVKPVEEFQKQWNSQRKKHYRMAQCKPCRNEGRRVTEPRRSNDPELVKRRERYANDPEFRRRLLSGQYKARHGITLDERDAMLAAQGNCCAVCKTTEPPGHGWHLDHDHRCCPEYRSCGKCVRGILCHNCNLALGHAGDSIERLQALIDYLMLAGMSGGGDPNLSASVSRMIPM